MAIKLRSGNHVETLHVLFSRIYRVLHGYYRQIL